MKKNVSQLQSELHGLKDLSHSRAEQQRQQVQAKPSCLATSDS